MKLILFTYLLLIGLTHSDSNVDRNNYTAQGTLNIQIQNITGTSAHLSWTLRDSHQEIVQYELTATIIRTYSNSKIYPLKWTFSNNTLKSEISGLHPSSTYNVTLRAVVKGDSNIEENALFDTDISEPDQVPRDPEVLKRDGSTMVIKLFPVINNNGPVSFYRVIVLNVGQLFVFQAELLNQYEQANVEGLPYYITADIDAQNVNDEFIIGDRSHYNGFYNAPLDENGKYSIFVGVVSTLNGKTRVQYPTSIRDKLLSLQTIEITEDSAGLVIALWVAIVLACLLLIAGVIVLVILRRRFHRNRRQRLSDNQELSIRGSMIQVVGNNE